VGCPGAFLVWTGAASVCSTYAVGGMLVCVRLPSRIAVGSAVIRTVGRINACGKNSFELVHPEIFAC